MSNINIIVVTNHYGFSYNSSAIEFFKKMQVSNNKTYFFIDQTFFLHEEEDINKLEKNTGFKFEKTGIFTYKKTIKKILNLKPNKIYLEGDFSPFLYEIIKCKLDDCKIVCFITMLPYVIQNLTNIKEYAEINK
jgi:hypothetical protein